MRNNLAQLRATSMLMDSTQNRIATGNKVNSALDDPTAFFKAKGLKDDANDLAVLKDDMGQTISAIQAADKAITSITSLVEQAKSLANSAKSESSSAERLSLAAQFDDIRAQIDTLAADASYGGQNLVTGRGVITGGTFLDTSSTAEAALAGVGTGGIARTGTDTNVGDYTFAVDQKLNDLNTVMVGSTTISTTIVGSTGGGTTTAGDQLDFYIDGVKAGTVTMGATATETGTTYAAKIDALSSDLTAAMSSNALNITVAQGKVLEIREGTTIGTSGGLLTDLGLSAGLQNDSTGATVVDLTSDLGVYGAEIYAHVNGYTPDANSTNVTFAVSGTTLTITDGTTGSTATMDTTVFSTAGTDTLAVGDMTVNFVTTLSTEQTNTQPTVAGTVSAVAQISTATWNTTTALATQIDTITIANAEVGDVYTAIVDGVTYAFTATDTNETNVAAGLASAISTAAGTLATTSASAVVTLTAATSGTPFTATATTTDRTRDNTQSIATATGTAHSAGATSQISTVTIAGTVEIGDVFTVNMTSDNDGTADYTFTATAATVTSVATGLAGLLDADADITATITNGVITLNEQASAGSGFTFNSSAANDKATDNTQSATQATATANGPGYSTGDAITVVINGNSYTHTLTAPALTRTLAATAFYDAMKATIEAAENVTVTDNSAHVLTFTSDTAGDVFTISATQSALVGAAEGAPTVATGTSNVVQESTVAIAANIDDGDVYSVT
ncbi:MAG: hypothetical protein HOK06_01470, partial [Rhodospirillaceae bacterium]|nr:hypothetical protein [Rhodospirillaceae bacterium]